MTKVLIIALLYPASLLYLYLAGKRGGVWNVLRFILLLPLMALAAVLELWRLIRE